MCIFVLKIPKKHHNFEAFQEYLPKYDKYFGLEVEGVAPKFEGGCRSNSSIPKISWNKDNSTLCSFIFYGGHLKHISLLQI